MGNETTTGCRLAGDSMGRLDVTDSSVGEEAASTAFASLGGCADEHLQNQLVIFMVLAQGTSRLRLCNVDKLDNHMADALRLAERIGARVRLVPDGPETSTGILEVDGMGSLLVV